MMNSKADKVSTNLTITNQNGYYHSKSKVTVKGRSQNADAILVTAPGSLPQRSQCSNWQRAIIMELPSSWCTRSRIPTPRTITPPPASKRLRRHTHQDDRAVLSSSSSSSPRMQTTQPPHSQTTQLPHSQTSQLPQLQTTQLPQTQSYWQSPEANKYFGLYEPVGEDSEIEVKHVMQNRIMKKTF